MPIPWKEARMKARMYRLAISGSALLLLVQALGAGKKWG